MIAARKHRCRRFIAGKPDLRQTNHERKTLGRTIHPADRYIRRRIYRVDRTLISACTVTISTVRSAHARMLGPAGDHRRGRSGSNRRRASKGFLRKSRRASFEFTVAREDIHMNIEARLIEKIGAVGGKLHTARSRNDQVALDVRLYLRDEIDAIAQALGTLQAALLDQAEENLDVIMPGYTHLQTAQPVLFAHHLLAYFEMLARDTGRAA